MNTLPAVAKTVRLAQNPALPHQTVFPVENPILYEQPLNERMRTFLRLEQLFRQTRYSLGGFAMWDSRHSVHGLIEILELLARGDLKNEILKELERLQASLTALQDLPGVDQAQLGNVLHQLQQAEAEVHGHSGQFGQHLRDNELLASIRQRTSIIGGDCNFDLPAYHHWLSRDPEKRIADLESWLATLDPVIQPISMILAILRESADAREQQAAGGFYQQNLDPAQPVQLLRIQLPQALDVFPEISAGKHRFSIRFLEPRGSERPVQTDQNVDFLLSLCAL